MARTKGTRSHDGFVRKVNGHFQGCITINGKDYRRYLNATNARDAEKAWKVLRSELLAAHPVTERRAVYAGATDFVTAFDRFIAAERKRRNVSHRLETEYRNYWGKFAGYCQERGVKTLEAVTDTLANDYTLARSAEATGSTIKKVMATLTKVWRDAMPSRPAPFTEKRVATASARHALLTATEVNALISAARKYDEERGENEWESLFRFAAQTGQRLTDCAHFDLRAEYDFVKHIVTLRPRKILNRKLNNRADVSGVTVRIPVFGELVEEISRRAGEVPVGTLEGRTVRPMEDGPLYFLPKIAKLADGTGSQLTPHINRIFAMAGISTKPYVEGGETWVKSFHSLRVFCVTRYGNAGMTLAQATAIFGWATVQMYAHYFQAEDDILTRLGKLAFVASDEGRKTPISGDVDFTEAPEEAAQR